MKLHRQKWIYTALSVLLIYGCTGSSRGKGENANAAGANAKIALLHSISPLYGTYITQNESQHISYKLQPGVTADSVVLFLGDRRIPIDSSGYRYRTALRHPTGRVLYKIVAYLNGESDTRSGEFTVLAAKAPKLYQHEVVKRYPHRGDAYTQGLLWYDGYLYESTGIEGHSSLRKVELSTGTPLLTYSLDNSCFGEGLALLDGKLYQLTWHNNKAFVYRLEDFEPIGQFEYSGEGWGLTSDGHSLYMSDGSEKIYVLDPKTFKRLRTLEVYTDQSKVIYINEMEWINGEIWANIYMTDTIIRIDPNTGAVTGVIDMSNLLDPADRTDTTDVLNGIAYDSQSGHIYVTGKNWSRLFEITVHPK